MFQGQPDFQHGTAPITGVLLANLGTPDAPTPKALRRYLGQFFADRRVFEFHRLAWWILTHLIILRVRPQRSAALYAKVWGPDGSPLLAIGKRQAASLQTALERRFETPVRVALGMRYGSPSIHDALESLRLANARRLLIFPIFPQYSATTVASVFDAATTTLQRWRWLPDMRMITHYHDDPGYIAALAASIQTAWSKDGPPEKLLFSFHGIPKRYFDAGDPYYCECHKTARLVAEQLDLPAKNWQVAFQSRFGREPWLKPYTDETLAAWGAARLASVDVVCPAFAADCLETLEEIAVENQTVFHEAGGGRFRYIPALNDDPAHIEALAEIAVRHCAGWTQQADQPVLCPPERIAPYPAD